MLGDTCNSTCVQLRGQLRHFCEFWGLNSSLKTCVLSNLPGKLLYLCPMYFLILNDIE